MPEIIMVRHGQASANFRESVDPCLSDLGRNQARQVAARLEDLVDYDLFTSPLKRAQETAAPLAKKWSRQAILEPRVSEIPSEGVALADRGEWLTKIMSLRWSSVDGVRKLWREELLQCVIQADTPRIYFSHFISINVLVGAVTGDDRVVCTYPKNTSMFRFCNDGGELSILEVGDCKHR